MSVKTIDYTSEVGARIKHSASVFLRFSADTMHAAAQPVTPYKRGNLSQDVLKQVLGLRATVEWRKSYAAPQERGIVGRTHAPVRHYTTPGTGKGFALKGAKAAVQATGVNATKAFKI